MGGGCGRLGGMLAELQDLSNHVWQRLQARLEGLTDEEYHWEPAPGCWGIRTRADGSVRADVAIPATDPVPFTTIAWRLWHVIDLYGESRLARLLGIPPQGTPVGLDDPDGSPPATAAEALTLLDGAHHQWDAHLALASAEQLALPIGDEGGSFADQSGAAFVLHMLDEFIHHGAELGTLRDLWRWQHPVAPDARIERVMRGDPTVAADWDDDAMGSQLLDTAAQYGRWELARQLLEAGARPSTGGVTALHRAAGAGELETVKALVAAGSDVHAVDPEFGAVPAQWAQFLSHDAVADWLADQ